MCLFIIRNIEHNKIYIYTVKLFLLYHNKLFITHIYLYTNCFKLFSTSVESRTEKLLSVRTDVRTMPLILANSYKITSILHMVLSTVTVSVFIEKIF